MGRNLWLVSLYELSTICRQIFDQRCPSLVTRVLACHPVMCGICPFATSPHPCSPPSLPRTEQNSREPWLSHFMELNPFFSVFKSHRFLKGFSLTKQFFFLNTGLEINQAGIPGLVLFQARESYVPIPLKEAIVNPNGVGNFAIESYMNFTLYLRTGGKYGFILTQGWSWFPLPLLNRDP